MSNLWSRIVRPKGGQPKANDRKYLLHIVDKDGKTGCGRDPEGWDMPLRGLKKMPFLEDDQFCKICLGARE